EQRPGDDGADLHRRVAEAGEVLRQEDAHEAVGEAADHTAGDDARDVVRHRARGRGTARYSGERPSRSAMRASRAWILRCSAWIATMFTPFASTTLMTLSSSPRPNAAMKSCAIG